MARYKKEDARFSGNIPLFKYVSNRYPDKLDLKYNYFEPPKPLRLIYTIFGEPIDLKGQKMVFGIRGKEEELVQYDCLTSPDGPAFVVHERILAVMHELCPNDFQALPVTIKNLKPECQHPFENHDFYLINILKIFAIFDPAYVYYSPNGVPKFKKKVVIEGSMGDSLLARDEIAKSHVFFHPSLAKHFIKSKGVQFLTAEEAP